MDDSWIQTFTGKKFWPLNPRIEDICVEDIAHALSLKCRFNCHCTRFYSVGQHTLNVAAVISTNKLWALLHDAAEAYLPDVPRPVKKQWPWFRKAEYKILLCIAEAFNLKLPIPEEVLGADLRMLATEKKWLMSDSPEPWPALEGVEPYDMWGSFSILPPEDVKERLIRAIIFHGPISMK